MTAPIHETITFSVQLAVELGSSNLAMIVQFFKNTIMKHNRMGRNIFDGFTWNYCTRAELSAQFPFLSPDQVKRCLAKLLEMGILKVGNFNKRRGDNTNWYAFADEEKWGIPKIIPTSGEIAQGSDEIARGSGEIAQALPLTEHRPTPPTYKVNDGASPSLTSSINDKRSLYKGKAKYTADQMDTFEWLKSLNLDTSEATLSWWARSYTLSRLDEVHREALKRKPRSIGAYMQKLLKKAAVVVSGRVELNAEFCKLFKELRNWTSLEIHQKYASINRGNHSIEIDFNMEPEAFKDYLCQKHETFEGAQ